MIESRKMRLRMKVGVGWRKKWRKHMNEMYIRISTVDEKEGIWKRRDTKEHKGITLMKFLMKKT